MLNRVTLIGNLGRDPELRFLEGNLAVCNFSIATEESYKDKKGDWQTLTEWHNIVVWRGLAEKCQKQLLKGSKVLIEGKLQTQKYNKDGQDHYATKIVADNVRWLSGAKKGENNSSSSNEDSFIPPPPVEDNSSYDDLPF